MYYEQFIMILLQIEFKKLYHRTGTYRSALTKLKGVMERMVSFCVLTLRYCIPGIY